MVPEYDYLLKLAIVGDASVGKTCLMTRFVDDTYTEQYQSSIGVDFKARTISVLDKKAKLQIWDTAGSERYRSIDATFYQGTAGIVLAYDMTDKDSFANVEQWSQEIYRYASENVPVILVGTKSDLVNHKTVSSDEAKKLADSKGWSFIETSSKHSTNVEQAFLQLVQPIVESRIKQEQKPRAAERMCSEQQSNEVTSREDLIKLLQNKAWHKLTSFGAWTPEGFKQILKQINQKPALRDDALMKKISEIASQRNTDVVKRRFSFLNGKRNPKLQAVYQNLARATTLVAVDLALREGLQIAQEKSKKNTVFPIVHNLY